MKQVKVTLTVEAYEDYYAGAPKIKTLVFKQVPDASTRAAEVLAGTADAADAISPTDIARIKSSGNADMMITPTVRRVLLDVAIDTTPELADKRVRQAIAYAIDKDAINQAVYDGLGGKQTGWSTRSTATTSRSNRTRTIPPSRRRC